MLAGLRGDEFGAAHPELVHTVVAHEPPLTEDCVDGFAPRLRAVLRRN